MIRLLLAFFCITSLAQASETVVADLSQNHVSITTDFNGSEIIVFGAVKRDSPVPAGDPLEVIIAVAGPSTPLNVRRKTRELGIWINTSSVEVDLAPSFYAVASTGPLGEVMSATEDQRHKVSINNMIRSVGTTISVSDPEVFTEAVVRIRQNNGLYSQQTGLVTLIDDTLFQTKIALPSNLVEGDYQTRIYLTRGGKVVDLFETSIKVQKVGLERWIYNLAHQKPLIYGLLSLFIAIVAGWLASAIFRVLKV